MATAEVFVRSALLKVMKIGAEQPIQSQDAQDVLTELNDLMLEWEGTGIQLGFTVLTGLGDEVTIPAFANSAVKHHLAIRISPEYGRSVHPATALAAKDALDALLNAIVSVGPVVMGNTVPVGAGNECGDGGSFNNRFFPGPEGTVLTETGGAILTEEDTE